MKTQIQIYQNYVEEHPERLPDLCYTLSQRREYLPFRAFATIQKGLKPLVSSIEKFSGKTPPIAMIFSGQGAQWPEMGKELIDTDVIFHEDIVAMDHVLQRLKEAPDWTIKGE